MAKVFTTSEYILIDRNTGKPYRSELGFTLTAPTRQLARDDKRWINKYAGGNVTIAKVQSRYKVENYVR
jgi:hypothetical protein